MFSSKWTEGGYRMREGMKRKPELGVQQGIKDSERVLQTPGQFSAVMNIRAAA